MKPYWIAKSTNKIFIKMNANNVFNTHVSKAPVVKEVKKESDWILLNLRNAPIESFLRRRNALSAHLLMSFKCVRDVINFVRVENFFWQTGEGSENWETMSIRARFEAHAHRN